MEKFFLKNFSFWKHKKLVSKKKGDVSKKETFVSIYRKLCPKKINMFPFTEFCFQKRGKCVSKNNRPYVLSLIKIIMIL